MTPISVMISIASKPRAFRPGYVSCAARSWGQRCTVDTPATARAELSHMSRPLRVQFEGAAYHVTARGNERKKIFRDDDDRLRFLKTLEDASSRFGLVIHAYCLMPNHYHLLVETPRGNLSRSIGWLQATYTTRFNRRHGRSGHLMQGRFKAHLVESARSHGLVRPLIRYIHLNPVRPKDRSKAVPVDRQPFFEQYPWSSHRAYAGTSAPPAWLSTEWLSHWQERAGLSAGVTRLRRAYRADVTACFGEVIQSPWSALRAGLVLGGEELWEKAKRLLGASTGKAELALARRDTADQIRAGRATGEPGAGQAAADLDARDAGRRADDGRC